MADDQEFLEDRLRQIADSLGIPLEQFYGDVPPSHLADTNELLNLWYRLKTDAERNRALDALRSILDEKA
ncbi:hypothetical protein [Methylobacterium sp. A54F]